MRYRGIALSIALLASVAATPARASISEFITATCGANCADPVGEENMARDNWSALTAMGTTKWIGSRMGSSTVDASALLAASRVAGATELDRWLSTGQASDNDTAQAMSIALQQYVGIDVSGITGNLGPGGTAGSPYQQNTSNDYLDGGSFGSGSFGGGSSGGGIEAALGNALMTSLTGGQGFMGPGGGGASGYCDQGVDNAVSANAQKYVKGMQDIATDKELGFSMLGGQGISSGQRSQSGYFGSSCLDSMMSGTRDMLFKPPGLSSLLSQLGSMFGGGGGGGGGCGNAPSIMNQIAGSFPSGSFGAGNGGFFPYMGNGSAEEGGGSRGFTNGFGLSQMVGQTSVARQPASLTNLFSR